MHHSSFAVSLSAVALLIAAGVAPVAGQQTGPHITHCFVSLIDDIQVSAQEEGLLVEMQTEDGRRVRIEEGQLVQQGALVAQLDDRQARLQLGAALAELQAAKARADDEIEVQYSQAAHAVAGAELAAAQSINRRVTGSKSSSEIRRLELTAERSRLQIDRSKMERRIAALTAEVNQAAVDAAKEAIYRRRVASPVDGMVVTVFKKPGEWVQAGEPVVRVARINRLRIEGFVSAAEYNASELAGRSVSVHTQLARGRKLELPGRVTFVSPLVQAGNRYRVRAEVENREEQGQWLLRPGMPAAMTVRLN